MEQWRHNPMSLSNASMVVVGNSLSPAIMSRTGDQVSYADILVTTCTLNLVAATVLLTNPDAIARRMQAANTAGNPDAGTGLLKR
jgi:hypothetical protein